MTTPGYGSRRSMTAVACTRGAAAVAGITELLFALKGWFHLLPAPGGYHRIFTLSCDAKSIQGWNALGRLPLIGVQRCSQKGGIRNGWSGGLQNPSRRAQSGLSGIRPNLRRLSGSYPNAIGLGDGPRHLQIT